MSSAWIVARQTWRRCGIVLLAVLAVVVPRPAPLHAQAPATLTLGDAISRALEMNPAVVAARSGRAIDLAGIQAASQRPNPEVSIEAERETPHWSFGGSLPLELAGKRQRRVDVARATLGVNEAEIARVTAEVRADLRHAYFAAVGAQRRLAITQDVEQLATQARTAAQERFESGAAPRLDALQALVALSQARNDVAVARGEVTATRAELNALLGYPVDAAPVLADVLEGPPPPDVARAQGAQGRNVELEVLTRRIEEERARVVLARAMRRPDPSVAGTLTYDARPEFTFGWRFGLAVALPVFTTGHADVAVAEATLTRAVAERDARAAQVSGAVAAAAARAASAYQAVLRYQTDILPATVQVEQMAQESYQSGQTGLAALLQAVQSARETRLRALQAGLDYQLALAELERAVGGPLP